MTDMTVGNVLAAKTAGMASSKSKDSAGLTAEFAGIMNQNQQSFLNAADYTATADTNAAGIFSLGSTDTPQANYEKLGTGTRQISQTDAKTQTVEREDVQKLAESVEDAVKDTMDVDDEQLADAMEELGLTAMDLLQPQNLIQLMQSLTGSEDVSGLLTDESFQLTMQDISGLLADFQQANGLDVEGFNDLVAQLSENIDELAEAVEDLEALSDAEILAEPVAEDVISSGEEPIAQEVSDEKPAASTAQPVRQEAAEGEPVAQAPQEVSAEEPVPVAERSGDGEQQNEPQQNLADTGEEPEQMEGTKDKTQESFTEAFSVTPQENTTEPLTADIPQVQTTEQLDAYIELQNLMDQMDALARTYASSDGTTVEMQLNPENLGRLTLTVSEKQGNVTAQIIASNEQVKEALQTQVIELRSTLQSQGVRVQAVEVTVASHEFEQNLDGNTSANGQAQEEARQQAQPSRRRNLDFNNLDELSGLMSEEETLAATMMRDNGGSVDYTA